VLFVLSEKQAWLHSNSLCGARQPGPLRCPCGGWYGGELLVSGAGAALLESEMKPANHSQPSCAAKED
jgi:hypothetical protein